MEKYILYARKSTDTEDKQVLSIEAQLTELRNYANNADLQIVDEFVEKRSAKMPGRPVFNEMLTSIKNGEANGILAWHPDRLARNSIDGGQIIYLLDQTLLNFLRFPIFQFENTSQGKFMLSIMFGQSKYYVDNLSENTKRGLRAKVRRGEYPSVAPLGYLNDIRSKSIILDKRFAPLVVQAFERYARGDQRMQDIAVFLNENGVITRGGKVFKDDRVKSLLQNPFYYGHFRYGGELYEGKHTPLISKALYDEVQTVIVNRSNKKKPVAEPQVFCGLLKCAECGMGITATKRIKQQKNGNRHEWIYYHCSRKNKKVDCHNLPIRSESLAEQLSSRLMSFQPSGETVALLEKEITKTERLESGKNNKVIAGLREQITGLSAKQNLLLDTYLDQVIDRQTFIKRKDEILSQKKTAEEKLSSLERNNNVWVKPLQNWLKSVNSFCKTVKSGDLLTQKAYLLEIYGSNLFLENKTVIAEGEKMEGGVSQKHLFERGQKGVFGLYSRLKKLNEKVAISGDNSDSISYLAGMEGFEPPNAGTRNQCLTTWRHPINITDCTAIYF